MCVLQFTACWCNVRVSAWWQQYFPSFHLVVPSSSSSSHRGDMRIFKRRCSDIFCGGSFGSDSARYVAAVSAVGYWVIKDLSVEPTRALASIKIGFFGSHLNVVHTCKNNLMPTFSIFFSSYSVLHCLATLDMPLRISSIATNSSARQIRYQMFCRKKTPLFQL